MSSLSLPQKQRGRRICTFTWWLEAGERIELSENFVLWFYIEVAASVPPVDGMIGALVLAQSLHHWKLCLISPWGRLYWKPSHFAWAMVYIGAPFNPFSDISIFEWATSEAFQWEHATGVCGWPSAELRILVNGLRDLAFWDTWTQWPKTSETKMSLTGTLGQKWTKADMDQSSYLITELNREHESL